MTGYAVLIAEATNQRDPETVALVEELMREETDGVLDHQRRPVRRAGPRVLRRCASLGTARSDQRRPARGLLHRARPDPSGVGVVMAKPRAYDPAKHGRASVWSGANAEARCSGVVDGNDNNQPRPRASFPTAEAAEVYRTAYLEHWNREEVALFVRPKIGTDQ